MNTLTGTICILNGIVPLMYLANKQTLTQKLPKYLIAIFLTSCVLNVIGGITLLKL